MTSEPDDTDETDREILASLAEYGIDPTQPQLIEFSIAVPDGRAAVSVEAALSGRGYDIALDYERGGGAESDSELTGPDVFVSSEGDADEEDSDEIDASGSSDGSSWTVFVTLRMVPELQGIRDCQQQFTEAARPFGGFCDGWGIIADEFEDDD